ncbi:MAG TPA: TonB-dependent receptor [Caulobacteraceae bacterium]
MNTKWLLTAAAPALAAALAPTLASAETAPTSAPIAAEKTASVEVNEVIVTAQKRSQSINTVSMSITAATGATLKAKNVTDVSDLTRLEPSLQYADSQQGTPVLTLRGVGYFDESLAASPTVSVYQDETPYPFSALTKGALLDPERVEVLKGPQGTLFGQNATGGAINFIAAKPTATFAAGVDASLERFNRTKLEGFISGPISSTLTARLSASLDEGGAWQKSRTRNDTLGNKDTQVGRLILDWKPTDRFKARLNLNGWEDHSETQALQVEGIRFASPQYISPNALTPLAANFLPNPAYFATYPASIQALLAQPTSPTNDQQADWAPGTHPHNDESFYQASLRLDYDLADGLGLTSLTSYEHFREKNQLDEGGVGIPYANGLVRGGVSTVFQELRLHGTFPERKGSWILGVNYESDSSHETDFFSPLLSSPAYLTGGSAFSVINIAPFEFGNRNNVDTTTKAVFGHVEYPLISTLSLNAGVRYTQSDQKIANCSFGDASITTYINALSQTLAGAFGAPAPTPVSPGECTTLGAAPNFQPGLQHSTLNENNVAWRAGLDWTPLPHNLFYFVVSKGYKAGASPSLGATSVIQLQPVTQEAVLSYEVGAKSTLLDGTLQINTALFHYDYTNKQEYGRIIDPIGIFGAVQALVNVPKSTVDGAEVSAEWRPIHGLRLNVAATYLDSKVTSDFINFSTYILSASDTINYKGEAFPYTPKWSVQYGVRYDWSLTGSWDAYVSADASYQSPTVGAFGAFRAADTGAPSLAIKGYGLLNLAAGVQSADKHWAIDLFGRNVTNTYYWSTVYWASDQTFRVAGQPSTYGIRVHYRY